MREESSLVVVQGQSRGHLPAKADIQTRLILGTELDLSLQFHSCSSRMGRAEEEAEQHRSCISSVDRANSPGWG